MATKSNLIKIIANNANISTADAAKVFDLYVKEKIIKLDGCCMGFVFTHGAFLEADVIHNAVDHLTAA